jgi:hypothetical protein
MRCDEERISSGRANPDHAPASLVHDARRRRRLERLPSGWLGGERGSSGKRSEGSEGNENGSRATRVEIASLGLCLAAGAWKLKRTDGLCGGVAYFFPQKSPGFRDRSSCSARYPQAGYGYLASTPERGPGRPRNGLSMENQRGSIHLTECPRCRFATSDGSNLVGRVAN